MTVSTNGTENRVVLPAPEGMWAIIKVFYDVEEVTEHGHTREIGVGEPKYVATPVIGFALNDSGTTFFPLILNSGGHFAEPWDNWGGERAPDFLEAYVLTSGSVPFVASGYAETNIYTVDTLPEKYRHLLAPTIG